MAAFTIRGSTLRGGDALRADSPQTVWTATVYATFPIPPVMYWTTTPGG